ncbi:MAG: phosphomannomutase/phosphoglucomutase [Spirochaetaceae bacterium]|nr:phosphomannomutase/phosphoglucomutase [Spirochaetaceae bacterium]
MQPSFDVRAPAFRAMFREYDLRGRVAEEELSDGSVRLIANAFGRLLAARGMSRAVVGYDNRPVSPGFKEAAVDGLTAAGIDVVDIGLTISPALYFSQHHLGVPAGLMVTASHNPSEWCGMKLAHGLSRTLGPAEMRELYALVTEGERGGGRAGTRTAADTRDAYLDRVTAGTALARPLRVAVDCGNGAAGVFAYEALQRIGCLTFQLYCDPDDRYPHYFPNPSDLKARRRLREIVTHPYIRADAGLAFDGDGDRIGVMDERGADVWSDRVLILLARRLLRERPGATVVYDVKCTRGLEEAVRDGGGRPVMWKTGHSHIKAKLHELNAELAGERSGHIFYGAGFYGFDDALYAGIRLLEVLADHDGCLSGLVATTPPYLTSPEIAAHCPDDVKYAVVDRLVAEFKADYGDRVIDINGARVDFGDGWGLVRASSNLPELVIIFEARTEQRLREIRALFRARLDACPEIDPQWRNDTYA